ncbi:MAG: metal-dependent transcriptional regulator [Promethearchaeota archaeon]|nr:MAG: metal-dependent transcriptional regulator [Candidatus Lokiarchaeota archaeon]
MDSLNSVPESYQRYLDEIYEIAQNKKGGWVSNKEISESLNVEPASVTGMLEKLKSANYIVWKPRSKIRLTKEGKEIARKLNKAHSLLRVFFKDVLKISDEDVVENLSCDIEHHLNKKVVKKLELFLNEYLSEE